MPGRSIEDRGQLVERQAFLDVAKLEIGDGTQNSKECARDQLHNADQDHVGSNGAGSQEQGVSVLVLCGRDLPQQAALPTTEDISERLRQERVNRRAQRYLRDLRRDAVIDYS